MPTYKYARMRLILEKCLVLPSASLSLVALLFGTPLIPIDSKGSELLQSGQLQVSRSALQVSDSEL